MKRGCLSLVRSAVMNASTFAMHSRKGLAVDHLLTVLLLSYGMHMSHELEHQPVKFGSRFEG